MNSSNPWEDFLAAQDPLVRSAIESIDPEDSIPVGERIVTRDEFVVVLGDQVAAASEATNNALRQDRVGAGMLASAWRQIIFRQAYAVLDLLRLGFEVEAQANARVCFEHAIALLELAQAADRGKLDLALEQLAADAGRFQKRQLDKLSEIDADSGNANRELLDAALAEHKRWLEPDFPRRQIKDMFTNVEPEGTLYSAYSRLSEAAHAGLGSAAPYLREAVRAGSQVLGLPERVPWAETLALLCWSCCAAEQSMLQFLNDGAEQAARQSKLIARVGLLAP